MVEESVQLRLVGEGAGELVRVGGVAALDLGEELLVVAGHA